MEALEETSQKPEREQLKERPENAEMHEAISERLPQQAVDEQEGLERQAKFSEGLLNWRYKPDDQQHKVSRQVDEDQPAGGPAEVRECERSGTDSCHRSP